MYKYRAKRQFQNIIDSKKKKDVELVKVVKKAIPRILNAPHNNDGRLSGTKRGQFKKYVGRAGYRIAYAICEDCRRNGHEELNDCPFCTEPTDDDTVVFFFAGRKKERDADYKY